MMEAALRSVRRAFLPPLLLAAAVLPAAAQARGAEATLEGRMASFLQAFRGDAEGEPKDFFPREGEWTWRHTTHGHGGDRLGVWRFRADETERAMEQCGPVWESFAFLPHGQPVGGLRWQLGEHGTGWRRVRGTRFVPPRRSSGSPVFVEWRRENGRWVIAAFGDESTRGPRLLGTRSGMIVRDPSPAAPDAAFAADERWYRDNRMITFEGYRYLKYGRPRPIEANQLRPLGRLGPVSLYVGAAPGHTSEEVVYVPVAAGQYQPYQSERTPTCP